MTERTGLDALGLVDEWPVEHVSAAVLQDGQRHIEHGDVDRPYPLASVTKLLTAVAVLVAVEEETIGLDEPAGPPGSTVRHLLAHASGLGPDSADTPIATPGTRRIYSNAGFEVLASHLAESCQIEFGTYLLEAVLQPLGMGATTLPGSPASGAVSTLADMVRFAAELLSPTVLSRSTLDQAIKPAFPDLVGVLPGYGRQDPNPWGLGIEIRGHKSPHWTGTDNSPDTFGHFGQSGTFLWVDPSVDTAVVVLTDQPFGPWAAEAWPAFSDAVLKNVR